MRRYGDLDLKRNVKGTCSVPFLYSPDIVQGIVVLITSLYPRDVQSRSSQCRC